MAAKTGRKRQLVWQGLLAAGVLALGSAQAETYGPVSQDETLWGVAAKLQAQHKHATIAQLAWAIYRANPTAFSPQTMKLKPGKTLNIPERAFIEEVSAKDARQQVLGETAPLAPTIAVVTSVPTAGEYGPVAQGETLWGIATKLRPQYGQATVAQVAWGLVQANAQTLEGKALPVGVTLKLPAADFVVKTSALEAKQQVFSRLESVPDGFFAVQGEPEPAASAPVPAAPATTASVTATVLASEAAQAAQPVAPEREKFRDTALGRELIGKRNAVSAAAVYARLAPLQEQFGGDPDYDYLLGIAALDSGHASEAVFALQRVVAQMPGFAGARLDLARAHYALGDYEDATDELNVLKGQNPPPEAAQAIEDYLAASKRGSLAYKSGVSGYAMLSAGYDSNANGATDTNTFLGIPLNAQNTSQDSSYGAVNLGVDGSIPLAPGVKGTLGAMGLYRNYPDASFVNSALARVSAGVEGRLKKKAVLGLTLSEQAQWLDGDSNNQLAAADAYGSLLVAEQWRVGANLRYGMLRYEAPLQIMDVDQVYLGAFAEGQLAPALRVQAALTLGRDEEKQTASPFGRDLWGLKAGAGYEISRTALWFASASGVFSDYSGLFFGLPRSDRQVLLNTGVEWRRGGADGYSFVTQLTAIDNHSDITLYDYQRVDVGIMLRKDFQ